MLEPVAKSIFDILYNVIKVFVSGLFSPVQLLLPNIFTGIVLNDYVTNFYGILNEYVIPSAQFFANMVPPMTWNLFIIYFTIMISLYAVVFTLHYILRPLRVIKKLVPFV